MKLPHGSFIAGAAICAAVLFLRPNLLSFEASLHAIKAAGDTKRILTEKTSRYVLFSSDAGFALPGTAFQRTAAEGPAGKGKRVSVTAGDVNGEDTAPTVADLQNTRFLNLESAEVLRLSRGFARLPGKIDAVERFVYQHIRTKTAGIPLLPAVEILRGRAGDCTEHTVLTVALLRSLGIHSRAMVGVVFTPEFDGLKNVFVFHMWAQAYESGRWLLVDSTCPGEKHPNRYIAFSTHSLKTEAPLAYLRAIAAIKDLTIDYLPR